MDYFMDKIYVLIGWNDETGHPLLASTNKKELEIQAASINNDWDDYIDFMQKGGIAKNYPHVEKLYEMTTIDEVELI